MTRRAADDFDVIRARIAEIRAPAPALPVCACHRPHQHVLVRSTECPLHGDNPLRGPTS